MVSGAMDRDNPKQESLRIIFLDYVKSEKPKARKQLQSEYYEGLRLGRISNSAQEYKNYFLCNRLTGALIIS